MMKRITLTLLICFICFTAVAQQRQQHIENIKNQLELLAVEDTGLTENLKLDINVNNVTIANFLMAVSKVHQVNIAVSPELNNITIINNFSDVTVADLLVFLCKEYNLDIDFTGNILSVKPYEPPVKPEVQKEIYVSYDPENQLISLDLKNDPLGDSFRKIMDLSGHNLLFATGMESIPLTIYLKDVPVETAMKNLALTNGLTLNKSRDGFFLFSSNQLQNPSENNVQGDTPVVQSRPVRTLKSNNFYYEVLDTLRQEIAVNFKNASIANVINEIAYDLKLNIYTATPLEQAGNITFKTDRITFDKLLDKTFESNNVETNSANTTYTNNSNPNQGNNNQATNRNNQNTTPHFTYKKEGNIYFFGTSNQLSVRKVEVVHLMHRSVELLGDPTTMSGTSRSSGRTVTGTTNYMGMGGNYSNQYGNNYSSGMNNNLNNRQNTSSRQSLSTNRSTLSSSDNKAEALVNILPDEIKNDLDIKIDYELNSFLVSGPASNINRFKAFIKQIDKPVPVILIEVMLLEVNRSATIEAGFRMGIGEEPTETQGNMFPDANVSYGAETINRVIGGFGSFGSLNFGQVVPNFYASIKALESNGNIKIKSTPRLSTLNGHRANLSIGETTYYVVTNQNYYGSQIPQSSEIRNYLPIDAELAVSIKPLVSGDGQITLDINVIQSSFSGERIEEDAPPGLTSREFSSIIRVRDQDLVILGGLEEKAKNDSGTGVPLLSRIPIIKWLFSSRKREDSKKKLTILIKPTVIY
ncbi:general secretion pathway protein GspD [Galbibacter sp. EGI 63066]|uniref:type II secretion system protein GspD n=1 Tax=Galbibacter sp. EGI 63066 TaxID=2993559 RepID=UPI0022490A17|nr:general secretion pathway protein GspD [Galbibacter sp. EGI 63066]MCX2679354.1 general secretion pathway protein GspD [Galbibacter sp. EGI 63066]